MRIWHWIGLIAIALSIGLAAGYCLGRSWIRTKDITVVEWILPETDKTEPYWIQDSLEILRRDTDFIYLNW